jgi:hypothetical protein
LLRNPGNQLPGLPTFTKNIFEKAISPMPAMLNAVQLESLGVCPNPRKAHGKTKKKKIAK